jgi:hypothetical protein
MTDRTAPLDAAGAEQLLVDTEPYLSCDECFARLDEYVEHRTRTPEVHDPLMETHLRGCGVCADEAAALAELLREPPDGVQDGHRTNGRPEE